MYLLNEISRIISSLVKENKYDYNDNTVISIKQKSHTCTFCSTMAEKIPTGLLTNVMLLPKILTTCDRIQQ